MKKKKSKRTLTPKLRFPEFRDKSAWEQRPLGVLTDPITERVGDSDCVPYTVTSGEGLISQEEKYGRTIAGKSLKNYYQLKRDDFAFNKSATKSFPQGYIARFQGDERAAVPNSIFTCFRIADENVDAAYLDYLFQGNLHGRWLKDYITVGARAHGALNISDDDLYALPIPLPAGDETTTEQQKIADCLSSLDGLIAAEGRMLEALRDHKRGLMQQLFPQPGQTQPCLRFPEFRDKGEWKMKKLGEVAAFLNGRAYKKEELLERGKYRVLRVGNFFTNENWYFSDLELDETKYCDNGDLLYAWSASFGPRIWEGERVIYHYHIWKVVENQGIDKSFLFTCLGRETEKMKAESANGAAMLHITKGTIESWDCGIPSVAEQQKIAACLTALDTQLAAQAAKIDSLKTHKRGLMQQLFPAPEEQ